MTIDSTKENWISVDRDVALLKLDAPETHTLAYDLKWLLTLACPQKADIEVVQLGRLRCPLPWILDGQAKVDMRLTPFGGDLAGSPDFLILAIPEFKSYITVSL